MQREYSQAAMIPHALADMMLERLEWMRIQPEMIIDLGVGDEYVGNALQRRYPEASLKNIQKDCTQLSFAPRSVDLITAHLVLTTEADIGEIFAECFRVLKPEGLFLFTLLGPDTLQELRSSLEQSQQQDRILQFIDMHDIGDALLQIGFSDPVMDCERITIEYARVQDVIHDLRCLRGMNHTSAKKRLTRHEWLTACSHYETYRRNEVLPATIELIHGHAWGAQPKQRKTDGGEITVPISQLTQGVNHE